MITTEDYSPDGIAKLVSRIIESYRETVMGEWSSDIEYEGDIVAARKLIAHIRGTDVCAEGHLSLPGRTPVPPCVRCGALYVGKQRPLSSGETWESS